MPRKFNQNLYKIRWKLSKNKDFCRNSSKNAKKSLTNFCEYFEFGAVRSQSRFTSRGCDLASFLKLQETACRLGAVTFRQSWHCTEMLQNAWKCLKFSEIACSWLKMHENTWKCMKMFSAAARLSAVVRRIVSAEFHASLVVSTFSTFPWGLVLSFSLGFSGRFFSR